MIKGGHCLVPSLPHNIIKMTFKPRDKSIFSPIKSTTVTSVCSSFISPQRKFSLPIHPLLTANGRKLFCRNGILLLNFALVHAQEHWKGEKNKHLPFNWCIPEMCRLRISALGAHTPACQALDLPTEFSPRDAPTLVSGLPRVISGLLQFAVLLPQAGGLYPQP